LLHLTVLCDVTMRFFCIIKVHYTYSPSCVYLFILNAPLPGNFIDTWKYLKRFTSPHTSFYFYIRLHGTFISSIYINPSHQSLNSIKFFFRSQILLFTFGKRRLMWYGNLSRRQQTQMCLCAMIGEYSNSHRQATLSLVFTYQLHLHLHQCGTVCKLEHASKKLLEVYIRQCGVLFLKHSRKSEQLHKTRENVYFSLYTVVL